MARLVKSFIGGITAKVTGGDVYETDEEDSNREEEEKQATIPAIATPEEEEEEEEDREEGSNEGGEERKLFSSDDDDKEDNDHHDSCTDNQSSPYKMATLSKWTNYLTGWQDRYVVVRDGILSYYKSEIDLQYGCRGSISLQKIKLFLHEFDELRFDIRAHDCTFFFRTASVDEKNSWVDIIEANKKFLNENCIKKPSIARPASLISLSGLSQASSSSFKSTTSLKVKLAEMETYRDILCKQIDILQAFFDASIDATSNNNGLVNGVDNTAEFINDIPEDSVVDQHLSMPASPLSRSTNGNNNVQGNNSPLTGRLTPKGHRRTGSDPFAFRQNLPARSSRLNTGSTFSPPVDLGNIDFRGEAITFKATTAGIISSLNYCIDVMNKREEYWKKKFDKEQERRRKAERAAHSALNGPRIRAYQYAGPDFQEGPHSALNEDEFFDALEMAYQEDEIESPENNSPAKKTQDKSQENEEKTDADELLKMDHKSVTGIEHKFTPMVNENVEKYSKYIFEPVDSNTGNWQLVHEDVDMKVYRRELEEDGVVVDPLKAQYIVKGLSGLEMARYFYEKDSRLEWEGTIESFNVLETLAEDTILFHQLHKRIWPSTQRETVFCSHLCTLVNAPTTDNTIGHTWMVCNFSIDHPSVPVTTKHIRTTIHIGMVCQTLTTKPIEPGKESTLTRDDISCKIIYAANVNPGGWAPPSVVRTIAKREITKFIKKISSCALKAISDQPLTL